jgi:ABC-2 type transport system permease protein
MTRYARLYAYFVRFAVSRAMEFRFDFFFRIVMDMVYYAVNIVFFKVIYNHVNEIAGWTEDQVLVFVAGYLFVDAVAMTIFSNNNWVFPYLVNKGDLDYYMVRPVSTFFFVNFRDFAANSFLNLIMTIGILAWTMAHCAQPFSAGAMALFILMLLGGTLIHQAMQMLFLIPVFWAHRVEGLRSLSWGIGQLGERPHRIYSDAVQRVTLSILPAALIASLPAYVLFEGPSLAPLANFLGVLIGFHVVLLLFWRFALRAYASASS